LFNSFFYTYFFLVQKLASRAHFSFLLPSTSKSYFGQDLDKYLEIRHSAAIRGSWI
jgi:hypothetical protein